MPRTAAELESAATHVAYEWQTVVAMAAQLAEVIGSRTALETAVLEAGLVHYRCVVNFCCGNFRGKWQPDDIQPSDFLGRPWWPQDEEFDRRLRGRLPTINVHLAHLAWDRLDRSVLWPFGLLAHEADYAMRLFLDQVPAGASWRKSFDRASHEAASRLPARTEWPSHDS